MGIGAAEILGPRLLEIGFNLEICVCFSRSRISVGRHDARIRGPARHPRDIH